MVRSLRSVGSNFMAGALMLVGIVAMYFANVSATSFSGWCWFYQPVMPKELIRRD